MIRRTLAAVVHAGLLASAAVGAPFQPIVGSSGTYIPGHPVTVEIRLPALGDLGAYNIDVVLESTVGAAGVDFYFDAATTLPAAADYLFSSSANFFDAVTIDSAMRHRITLTDFDFAGVNVIAGDNDRVAAVVFRTSSTFNGPLSLFVDAPLLLLDTPGASSDPVPGFNMIQTDIAAAGAVELQPVPEPATAVLLILGAAAGFLGRLTVSSRRSLRVSQPISA